MTMPAATNGARHLTPVPLPPDDCPILGRSEAIRRAIGVVMRFAPTDLPVLLVGATGTGKELFARELHARSGHRGQFVDVNCAALPREMVESLLFGHRRGAFTGANEASLGLMAAADQGTLFLDELTSLPMEGQAKLLRALDTREIRPLGETTKRRLTCRFIAAAQDDVQARVARGELRVDLFQRLAGVVIELPALVDRPEDILVLAAGFARDLGRRLPVAARSILEGHSWPGNVRELRGAIQRAAHLAGAAEEVTTESLQEAILLGASPRAPPPRPRAVSSQARALFELCEAHGWDVERAARSIGLSRATLYRRLRAHGLAAPGRPDPSLAIASQSHETA